MRSMDFSSWQGAMTTIIGLAVITLLGVGIRLIIMQTIQQRRERMNRQINERLKSLIAAYRTLGGSFTGQLTVDPPPVPVVFSSTDIAIDEARPDFNDRAFDTLRACLRYDLAQARGLIATTRLGDSLLDHVELDRYLAAT